MLHAIALLLLCADVQTPQPRQRIEARKKQAPATTAVVDPSSLQATLQGEKQWVGQGGEGTETAMGERERE